MAKGDMICVGGSAGSSGPLRKIVARLSTDFPGSVILTTHIPTSRETYLPSLLDERSALLVRPAVDGQPIRPGHIYVAPAARPRLLPRLRTG